MANAKAHSLVPQKRLTLCAILYQYLGRSKPKIARQDRTQQTTTNDMRSFVLVKMQPSGFFSFVRGQELIQFAEAVLSCSDTPIPYVDLACFQL